MSNQTNDTLIQEFSELISNISEQVSNSVINTTTLQQLSELKTQLLSLSPQLRDNLQTLSANAELIKARNEQLDKTIIQLAAQITDHEERFKAQLTAANNELSSLREADKQALLEGTTQVVNNLNNKLTTLLNDGHQQHTELLQQQLKQLNDTLKEETLAIHTGLTEGNIRMEQMVTEQIETFTKKVSSQNRKVVFLSLINIVIFLALIIAFLYTYFFSGN